jgi:lysine 2,3-aminomutase
MDWSRELADAVTSFEELSNRIHLTEEEKAWGSMSSPGFRLSIPRYYLNLIDGEDDPIRRQCIPRIEEYTVLDFESTDPLAEDAFTLSPRLVRRYKSRAVFLATDRCAMYCRHCFRRRFSGGEAGIASGDEIMQAAEKLAEMPEVKELLISGGDPLTMSNATLERMLGIFRSQRDELVLRIGTRMPAVLPDRITPSLVDILADYNRVSPVYLMVQFNHPRELTAESRETVRLLRTAGIALFNQAVLLSGVNDDPDVLEQLFNELTGMGIKPYYLFQGDLAAGTSHFRTPLEHTFFIEQELRKRLSGLAMPVVAVDLPDGGGKIPLSPQACLKKMAGRYLFRGPEGKLCWYTDLSRD